MKRLTAFALITAFALALLPAATFAQTANGRPPLPAYDESRPAATATCPNGETAAIWSDGKTWEVIIYSTAAGPKFYDVMTPKDGEVYYVDAAKMSHEEWDKKLSAASAPLFGLHTGHVGDCKVEKK